ncbi:MAG: hypothetical protein K2N85_00280 [Lachnospiraceae bacterium]|nr:hypothetical protein [Lachnospiraceae bacterium]
MKDIYNDIFLFGWTEKEDYYKEERDDKREQAMSGREIISMIYCNHSEGG